VKVYSRDRVEVDTWTQTYSAVLGVTSAKSSIFTRPSGSPARVMSKKTMGFGEAMILLMEVYRTEKVVMVSSSRSRLGITACLKCRKVIIAPRILPESGDRHSTRLMSVVVSSRLCLTSYILLPSSTRPDLSPVLSVILWPRRRPPIDSVITKTASITLSISDHPLDRILHLDERRLRQTTAGVKRHNSDLERALRPLERASARSIKILVQQRHPLALNEPNEAFTSQPLGETCRQPRPHQPQAHRQRRIPVVAQTTAMEAVVHYSSSLL